MIDFYLLSVIVFFLVVFWMIYRNRETIEVQGYILFMKRTKRFRNIIDKIARKSPRFWKMVGTIAVIGCFYFMLQGTMLLLQSAYYVSAGLVTQPSFQFVLPSPTATGYVGPGLILIPFWYWIIIIAVILIPHEFLHGILARAEKIRLQSVGLLLLAIFPGAFVEPDEKQLKKAKLLTQLRIFSAGSAANIAIAGIIFVMLSSLIWPAFASPGVKVIGVDENSPAYLAGLKEGMIISQINGKDITSTYNEYILARGYFAEEVGGLSVNKTVELTANESIYDINVSSKNNTAYIGITYEPVFKGDASLLFAFLPLLTMIWMMSFAVGLVNILPLYPLDGGQMINAIFEKISKKRAKKITIIISYILLIILIFDFIGPFILNYP